MHSSATSLAPAKALTTPTVCSTSRLTKASDRGAAARYPYHSLPKGAVTVTVNSVNYREFGGVWYQPFYSGSEVIYQTVPNPTG
jgi:hypothetical protein